VALLADSNVWVDYLNSGKIPMADFETKLDLSERRSTFIKAADIFKKSQAWMNGFYSGMCPFSRFSRWSVLYHTEQYD